MKWIMLGITYDEFVKRGLLKVGVIIDFGGEKLLIGHLNEWGGACEGGGIDGDRIVKGYAIAVEPEVLSGPVAK